MAKSEIRLLAESLSAEKGIKVKSAMRYFQRVQATGTKQKIQNPKFKGVSSDLVEKIETVIKTPTESRIEADNSENPIKGQSTKGKNRVGVHATFEISNHITTRTIRLDCTKAEMNKIAGANSLRNAVAHWANTRDGEFLRGALISDIEDIFFI